MARHGSGILRTGTVSVVTTGVAVTGLIAGAGPAGAASGTERITVVETSVTTNTFPASATGPIHALGKDVQVNNKRDRFVFPKGAFVVEHHATASRQSFDKKNCTGRFTEQGTFRIVSGTKAYSHISGHGTYQLSGILIGCSQKKPPTAASIIINAAGPLSY